MKRKSLLFLLLMAMLAPLAMNGQTQLLTENFDNMSSISTSYSSTGWYAYNAGSGNNWTLNTSSSYANSGSNSAQVKYSSSYAANCYLVSKPFTVSSNMGELSVSLYERVRGYTETFEVFFVKASDVTTLAGVASATKYNAIASASYTNTTYAQQSGTVTNSALAGQSVRVVVHCTSAADQWYLYIDDITVNEIEAEACPRPTGLTANNITNNSATIAWDVEDGIDYEVQYTEITAAAPLTNGSWLQYDNGTYRSSIGNGNTQYDWTWGVMYPASMLNGKTVLSKISIYENSTYNTGDIQIDIYSGGTNEPETLIYTETVTPQHNDAFHEIQLSSPVTIDPTQNLWIVLTEYGYYVIPFCVSSETNNQWVENDGWMNISELSSNFSGYGWMIRGFIQEIDLSNLTGWQPLDSPYDLTGLNGETQYAVRVRANCDEDGYSQWAETSFTTLSHCATPYNLTTTNTTAASATLNWLGAQETYNVSCKKVLFFEDFEDGVMPSGWTTINNDNDSYNWYYDNSYSQSHSGSGVMSSASSVSNGTGWTDFTPDNWLVTPQLDLKGTMSVWVRSQQTNATYYQEHFAIYISTTGTNVSDFSVLVPESETTIDYVEYTADLSSYVGQQGYIAIRHFNCEGQFRMNIDDFGIYDDIHTVTANTVPFTINNLKPSSNYMWQVQGINCDGNGGTTNWSAPATFTTPDGYVKHIDNWSSAGYYLISSPIGTVNPKDVLNMITPKVNGKNTYDLYGFDQSKELEWRNYRASINEATPNGFDLEFGKGYLYGNTSNGEAGVDLVFTGTAYSDDGVVTLTKVADEDLIPGLDFPDWNLVGNPFPVDAYIADKRSSYTMNELGNEIIATNPDEAIEAMTGVFVVFKEGAQTDAITFTTTKPKPSEAGESVTLDLRNGNNVIDRAIVRFDEGQQLPKFQLNRNSTKLYIPQDGKDYAVVCSEEMGAMPVNFKAEDNGTYTLNFSCTNVGFAYLHLIDNKTGNDVDLLQTPSYSFEAKTTDYESRFKLVFATGDNSNDDNFAFFSNGSFVINNDGAAELQVIDLMGRILSFETINGCTNVNVNAAPGVYMLRLINGDNVKVQKVVVK